MDSRSRLTPTSPVRLETESSRLQRDTDTIAERLERERRQAVLLDDNLKTLEVELTEVKERIRSLKFNSKQEIQIQILERRLQLESTKLNEAQAENTKLRDNIDLLRRERMILKDLSSGISKEIVTYSKTAEEKFITNIQKQEIIAENLNQAKLLRSKSAVNKTRYTRQIRELSSMIKEGRNTPNNMSTEQPYETRAEFDAASCVRTMRVLLKIWKNKIMNKKKELEAYVKHVRGIEEAFQQIVDASGISIMEDIVTAIIKTEDQKSELLKYINELTTSIESEEEFQQFYHTSLNALRQSSVFDKKTSRDTVASLKKKFERMLEFKQRLEGEVAELTYTLENLGAPIEKLLETCILVNIPILKNEKVSREEALPVTAKNVILSLAYIEECIIKTQLGLASTKDERAELSRLWVSGLPPKEPVSPIPFDLKHLPSVSEMKGEFEDEKYPLRLPILRKKTLDHFNDIGIGWKKQVRSFTPQPVASRESLFSYLTQGM